jgi:hypothetical protein
MIPPPPPVRPLSFPDKRGGVLWCAVGRVEKAAAAGAPAVARPVLQVLEGADGGQAQLRDLHRGSLLL